MLWCIRAKLRQMELWWDWRVILRIGVLQLILTLLTTQMHYFGHVCNSVWEFLGLVWEMEFSMANDGFHGFWSVSFVKDDLWLFLVPLTVPIWHLKHVWTQVWRVLALVQEMVMFVLKPKMMNKWDSEFGNGWKSEICDGSNTFQTSFGVCLKFSLVTLAEIQEMVILVV